MSINNTYVGRVGGEVLPYVLLRLFKVYFVRRVHRESAQFTSINFAYFELTILWVFRGIICVWLVCIVHTFICGRGIWQIVSTSIYVYR